MHKAVFRIVAMFIVSFFVSPQAGNTESVQAQDFALPVLPIEMSADGKTLFNAVPPAIFRIDYNPEMQNIQDPEAGALPGPETAFSTFSINYIGAEQKDPWGQVCITFPDAAKDSFQAAAAIWAARFKSAVPITINACWANLGSSDILGYAGGQPTHRDFTGAPKAGTWYQGALANALSGSDQAPSSYDMSITYNSYYPWYIGTTGAVPAGQYDLVSAAAHEIGHGLNFTGSAGYGDGLGGFGYYTDYPDIYDRFMESSTGKKLISYTNPSAALGSLLTSGSLWFSGTKAEIANGGPRVKMYAPSTWHPGSSYAHLDNVIFNGTSNSLMGPYLGSGSSRHTIGPVILGLLQDLGWQIHVPSPTPVMPTSYITTALPTFKWTPVSGASFYAIQLYQDATYVSGYTLPASACSTMFCSKTITEPLNYGNFQWRVKAKVAGTFGDYSRMLPFYVMPPGFTSTFTTSSRGWIPVNSTWALHPSGYFCSSGVADQFASVKNSFDYPVLTYTVKMKRTGCAACANNLYFYGAPGPLSPTSHEWKNTYKFAITNDGRFMVGKMVGGVFAAVIDWTASPAIVKKDWNTLKVTVKDTFAQFFINNTRVAAGNIYSFSNGRVGFGFYRDTASRANKLYVDSARLSTSAPSAVMDSESESGCLYFNEATDEGITSNAGMNPDKAP